MRERMSLNLKGVELKKKNDFIFEYADGNLIDVSGSENKVLNALVDFRTSVEKIEKTQQGFSLDGSLYTAMSKEPLQGCSLEVAGQPFEVQFRSYREEKGMHVHGFHVDIEIDPMAFKAKSSTILFIYEDEQGLGYRRALEYLYLRDYADDRSTRSHVLNGERPYFSDVFVKDDNAVFLYSNAGNAMCITCRETSILDSPKEKRRIRWASILAKVLKFKYGKAILFFEKFASKYEESASVLYEKFLDEGETNAYFLIDRESDHLPRIQEKYRKNIIYKNTFKHYLMFFAADTFIATETMNHVFDLNVSDWRIRKRIDDEQYNYYFLQHGIMYMYTLKENPYFKKNSKGFGNNCKIVVSSQAEADHFIQGGNFTQQDLIVAGLPKFDQSYRNETHDKILIMPTSRDFEYNIIRNSPEESTYYQFVCSILNEIPEELKDKVILTPHPLIKDCFNETPIGKYIPEQWIYDELLRETQLLITDYSSIAYDAFYRGCNVLFCWEDKEMCLKKLGCGLMLDEETAFSDISRDFSDLKALIQKNYLAQEHTEEQLEKFRFIVEFHDNQNTKRCYDQIIKDIKNRERVSIKATTLEKEGRDLPYCGRPVRHQNFNLKYKDEYLTEGVDYRRHYLKNIDAGKGTVLLIGKGRFHGIQRKRFKILENINAAEFRNAVVGDAARRLAKCDVTYNGRLLAEGKDYVIKSVRTYRSGAYGIVIHGKGKFTGTKTVLTERLEPDEYRIGIADRLGRDEHYEKRKEMMEAEAEKRKASIAGRIADMPEDVIPYTLDEINEAESVEQRFEMLTESYCQLLRVNAEREIISKRRGNRMLRSIKYAFGNGIPAYVNTLSDEERAEYDELIRDVLYLVSNKRIAVDTMLPYNKEYLWLMKKTLEPDDEVYLKGKDIIYRYSRKTISTQKGKLVYLIISEIRGGKLIFEGYDFLSMFGGRIRLMVMDEQGNYYGPQITSWPLRNGKGLFDEKTCEAERFRFELPCEDGKNYNFALTDGFAVSPVHLNCGEFSKVENYNPWNYFAGGGHLVLYHEKHFSISADTPENHRLHESRVAAFLKENGEKDAVALRNKYHELAAKKEKPIWIFRDNETRAKDSAIEAFKFFSTWEDRDQYDAYFIIDENCADYRIVKQYGRTIQPYTEDYKLKMMLADKIIDTRGSLSPDYVFGADKKFYKDLCDWDYIWLIHGVMTRNESSWTSKFAVNAKLYATCGKREYEALLDEENGYGYDHGEPMITGLPRHDGLDKNTQKKIVFLPTWRKEYAGALIPGTSEREYVPDFKESEYFKYYNRLINDERLLECMRSHGYTGDYYLHPSFMKQCNDFDENDVICVGKEAADTNRLIGESALLLTDYSSAAFEAAYLGIPVIYTQYDIDTFGERHTGADGYFEYYRDGFGEVCVDYDDAVDTIIGYIENDCRLKDMYKERGDAFFVYRDKNNSRRVLEAVKKLDEGEKN